MNVENLKISELKPYENNPRKNDESVEYVANSIKEFGFKVPIIVDKNNVIVCGHTRYKAAKKIGMQEVPCIRADDLSDEQIKAFRLADNKVSDESFWDNKKLLEELNGIGGDMFTGFSESDLFCDVLDEDDNSLLENNESGVCYSMIVKTLDKEKYEKLKKYAEEVMKWETC